MNEYRYNPTAHSACQRWRAARAGTLAALLTIFAASAVQAADYYECQGADGAISHSVSRCTGNEVSRKIVDASAPATVRLGAGSGVVQVAGSGRGHFLIAGAINGAPVRMLVDTGASLVSISPSAARRMGIDLTTGRQITLNTANGQAPGVAVTLRVVEALGSTVREVAGVVMSQDMKGGDVLLGMSFLQHFDLNIEGNRLSARRK